MLEVSVKGEIITTFDPNDREQSVAFWLNKIEQPANMHASADYEKYNKSWEEWKLVLSRVFIPRVCRLCNNTRHKRNDECNALLPRQIVSDATMSPEQ